MDDVIYIVSDLHIGDGVSFRDNFRYRDKRDRFAGFLQFVGNRELLILGDCFEFWQAYIDHDLTGKLPILDTLAAMNVQCIAGNHDTDLSGFYGESAAGFSRFLNHPFFLEKTRQNLTLECGGKRFIFVHGHQGDIFNCTPSPDFGRVVTIIAGMLEDRLKSRYIWKDRERIPLESTLTKLADAFLKIFNKLSYQLGYPTADETAPTSQPPGELADELVAVDSSNLPRDSQRQEMEKIVLAHFSEILRDVADNIEADNADTDTPEQLEKTVNSHLQHMYAIWEEFAGDKKDTSVLIAGHTHQPGICGTWYYNSGSWCDIAEDVLILDKETGSITFHSWTESGLKENKHPTVFTI